MKTIKYAIYQGKIGKYAMKYCDTLESIKDYFYIKEDRLPVVINSMGGCHTFDLKYEDGFLEIIEIDKDDEPLTLEEMYPKNDKKFMYGWIDVDGNTYHTGERGHSRAADEICKRINKKIYNAERFLEEEGWIKTTKEHYNNNNISIYIENDYITKKQYETLCDLGLGNDDYVMLCVESSEHMW